MIDLIHEIISVVDEARENHYVEHFLESDLRRILEEFRWETYRNGFEDGYSEGEDACYNNY